MAYANKLAPRKLVKTLAATLLEKARDQIPQLTTEYVNGRTITDGSGITYNVYVGQLREELAELGYEYPKQTTATLSSW